MEEEDARECEARNKTWCLTGNRDEEEGGVWGHNSAPGGLSQSTEAKVFLISTLLLPA